MRKAFICHSSQDKEYVRFIASKLGRARVLFDELCFEPGIDFRAEIRRHLDSTALFVFIASKKSLASGWCQFELDEVELRKLHGGIQGQLTIIIDHDISYDDLPAWLTQSRAIIQTRPSQAARDVERALQTVIPTEDKRPLVGREEDSIKFRNQFYSFDRDVSHVISFYGLPAVGRRALLQRVVHDNLDLPIGPFFEVDAAQRLEDFYLFLLDETGDLETKRKMQDELQSFRSLDHPDKLRVVVESLRFLCQSRTVPCLVDAGGMLEPGGEYKEIWSTIIEQFLHVCDDQYLALIHRRRPVAPEPWENELLTMHIGPLQPPGTQALLRLLFRKVDIDVSMKEVVELSEYVDGYPPAAYAAVRLSENYSIDYLLADKQELIDFKTKSFQRFLDELPLTESQWGVLRYLAAETGMQLAVLSTALNLDERTLAEALRSLIDLSLVQSRDRAFEIAAPIRESVLKLKGFLGKEFYRDVASRLSTEYWSEDPGVPSLSAIDATLRAVSLSGTDTPAPLSPLIRNSNIERAALENYHQGDHLRALEYARRGQMMVDGDSAGLREVCFKCLIRLERWSEAEEELAKIEAANDRQYFFLKGFGLRFRGEFAAAISAFKSAIEVFDRRTAVRRELAFCYYAVGSYEKARLECETALNRREENNPYLLDMLVNIHLAMGDIKNAERVLRELDQVDVARRFIHHRRAVYHSKRKQFDAALREINYAIEGGFSLRDAHAVKVGILINAEMFEAATIALKELVEKFPSQRQDVARGLQIKSLTRQGKWREAMNLWQNISAKRLPVHQGLLKAILMQKSTDQGISLSDRGEARVQADQIAADLAQLDLEVLVSGVDD